MQLLTLPGIMNRVIEWIKRPANVAYILLVVTMLVVEFGEYDVWSFVIVLAGVPLFAFLIRKIFYRD